MPGFSPDGFRLMIVDDDALTLEAVSLLAEATGFEVEACESGVRALEALAELSAAGRKMPQGVLTDLQMPGMAGETLARLVRATCGRETIVLAMSGRLVSGEETAAFDGFLLKPFTMAGMCEALEEASAGRPARVADEEVAGPAMPVKGATFDLLAQTLTREQLRRLYELCLEDTEARMAAMRKAAEEGDDEGWRWAAHAMKGSCGMVGAGELAELAGRWERAGVPTLDSSDPFSDFAAALARVRRDLENRLP